MIIEAECRAQDLPASFAMRAVEPKNLVHPFIPRPTRSIRSQLQELSPRATKWPGSIAGFEQAPSGSSSRLGLRMAARAVPCNRRAARRPVETY